MTTMHSLSHKIVRNTMFNAAGRFWGVLVALVMTPYIVGHLGVERYGVWAFVGVVTSYFGLLDFGIGTSFVKYISEFYARKEYGKISQVVNTGFVFYSAFAVSMILAGFFFLDPLLSFFQISADLGSEVRFVFLLGIALFGVSGALSPFGAVQGGLQRMDVSNKIAIAVSIPNIIGTVFVLERGYGLSGLMLNNAGVLLISSALNIAAAFKLLPELRFAPLGMFSGGMFKKLLSFGGRLQATSIANLVHFQTDKIILAHFLNVEFVAYYAVAQNLVYKVREIPLMLISAIIPAASELHANTDAAAITKLYFRAMKYIILVSLPISALLILLARPFVNLWLGAGFERSVLTVQVFMVAYLFNIFSAPGFFILHGMGKPQYGMRSSALAAVLNLFLSVLLVIKLGYFGAVAGTAVSMIAAAVYFIFIFHKVLEIPFWTTFGKVFPVPFLACCVPGAAVYLLLEGQPNIGWVSLISVAAGYSAIFAGGIALSGHLDEVDKGLLNRCNPFSAAS